MGVIASLRMLASLRRIAKALESIASMMAKERTPVKTPKLSSVFVPDIGDMNDRWRAEREGESYDAEEA